jgi:FkbM family methyltransferase
MNVTSFLIKAPARVLLKKIPTSILEKIEDMVQKQLGKGSGAWSTKSEARIIADFAESLQIRNVVAIDAGANLGNWTAELLEHLPTANVFAFEPSKSAFEKLQTRFATDRRVSVVSVALGKDNKSSILYADKGGSGLGSLTKRRVQHFDIEFSHQEVVEINMLDSWISRNEIVSPPNILKMDVEGHEYDLLLGATETIKNIKIIQFEFGGSNIDTRIFFQDFWYFFQDLGFDVYRISPSKPILVKVYSERDESFRATNYIAVRKNAK